MAHILLAWEFGANRGHAMRLAALAKLLRGHGHRVSHAVQRIDSFPAADAVTDPVFQAPLTPRLLATAARPVYGPPASLGDIVARLGFDDQGIVAAMTLAWRALLDSLRPDLVIADFAPFLLTAARGRVPTIAVGIGFSCPPPELERFPPLVKHALASDEEQTLDCVNRGLAVAGSAPLESLPEIFAADRVAAEGFAELDPYADSRGTPLALPVPSEPPASDGKGDEIFVYGPERVEATAPIWPGLAAARLPVRVHVPRAPPALRETLAGFGFAFEPEALPFERIAERSRLLVSHGGHGFVSSGLAAGLPQVICHYDLEKLLTGLAVARLGLGGHASLAAIRPEPFANSLVQLYRDQALAGRARAAGEDFRRRAQPRQDEMLLEAVTALA